MKEDNKPKKNMTKTITKSSTKKTSSAKAGTKKSTPKNTGTKKTVKKPVEKELEIIKEEVIMKKEETTLKEFIPNRNMMLLTLLLGTLLVGITLARFIADNQVGDYTKSYLVNKEIVREVTCDNVINKIQGEESFIFVTTLNDENEYNLEKKLADIIKNYRLKDKFHVFVVNESCGSISDINSTISSNLQLDESIEKIPTILYYRDGKLTDMVTREDELMINDGDFVHLLDIYEIK